MTLVLASASPRRKALLQQIGVPCLVQPVDICEQPLQGEEAQDYVVRLALEKARAGFKQSNTTAPVLGSDTTVVFDGEILGKPENESDAVATLMRLSGQTHQVMTAVAVVDDKLEKVRLVITEVEFKQLTETQCRRYWASGEPADKAGSYGIQGLGAVFVEAIKGSYSAVVGLPLSETAELLTEFNVDIWQQD